MTKTTTMKTTTTKTNTTNTMTTKTSLLFVVVFYFKFFLAILLFAHFKRLSGLPYAGSFVNSVRPTEQIK